MWLLKKRIKVKLSILGPDGKPVYEMREAGDPCPEAAMFSKPLLWCSEVPDDGDSAKSALRRYKARTGHDIAGYEPLKETVDHETRQPSEDERTKAQLKDEIEKLGGTYKKSDNKEGLLVALSLAEKNAEKAVDVVVDGAVSTGHVVDDGGERNQDEPTEDVEPTEETDTEEVDAEEPDPEETEETEETEDFDFEE